MKNSFPSNQKIYILLPVHNRREVTLRFIECLKKQTCRNYHVIFVDDGSTDGTAESVLKKLEDITIIHGKGKWWWAGSLQQGHNWLVKNNISSDDYVLIMNDDTEFDDDFLHAGVQILEKYPRTILTATGYNLKTRQPQDSAGYKFVWESFACLETYDNAEMNCLSTRGMLARVGDFLSIGGFYPKLIPHYLSDLEFTMRAHERGLKLMINKDFRIYIDFEETGYRDISSESLVPFVKKMFSKRAAMNPISWTNFVLLRCPMRYKLMSLKRVWSSVYDQIVRVRLIPEIKKRVARIYR